MPLFCLVILFTLWLTLKMKKADRESGKKSEEFWQRESEALLTPRKSIDDVVFIGIPKEIIPHKVTLPEPVPADADSSSNAIASTEFDGDDEQDEDDEEDERDILADAYERINTLSAELRVLSKEQIADLSGYTNTDLRLKYGSPNFTMLSRADANYTRLVQILPVLIRSLRTAEMNEEAQKLLDFCDANSITTGELKKLH